MSIARHAASNGVPDRLDRRVADEVAASVRGQRIDVPAREANS
jgi:hypothetical protein